MWRVWTLLVGVVLLVTGPVQPSAANDSSADHTHAHDDHTYDHQHHDVDGDEFITGTGSGYRAAALPAPQPVVIGVGAPTPPTAVHSPSDTIVGGAAASDSAGWFVTSDGAVRTYGNAAHHGDLSALSLNQPIVAMAAVGDPSGYLLVAADGGVFAFGSAAFHGSTGHLTLQRPIVDIAVTSDGGGYLLVADDGGVFAFGNARFRGSMGAASLNEPIVGASLTSADDGYWLVARDGGIFAFGAARFAGSTGSAPPDADVVDLVEAADDHGYWLITEAAEVLAFGTASAVASPHSGPDGFVVAATRRGGGLWLTLQPHTPVVYAWQSGGLTDEVIGAVFQAANNAGGYASLTHNGTLGYHGLRRNGHLIHGARAGWRIAFTARAVEPAAAAPFHGAEVAQALDRGQVVMSRGTAALRGAQVGDVVIFSGWDGQVHERTVGAIVPDARVGSSELVFGTPDAASFGFVRGSSIWIGGISDLGVLETGLADLAAIHEWVRWARSWDSRSPDSTLPTIRLKELLGEFEYRPTNSVYVEMDPAWVAENIVRAELPILGRWRCHRAVLADLVAALSEIESSGLAELIDVRDSRHGGCWVAREIRGASGGTLSRHAWGLAVDINPSTNGWGQVPQMDLRIVDIFRKHGFAWGGTWTRPDGMHFEWIGGPS